MEQNYECGGGKSAERGCQQIGTKRQAAFDWYIGGLGDVDFNERIQAFGLSNARTGSSREFAGPGGGQRRGTLRLGVVRIEVPARLGGLTEQKFLTSQLTNGRDSVRLRETLKHALALLGGDANSRIADREFDRVAKRVYFESQAGAENAPQVAFT